MIPSVDVALRAAPFGLAVGLVLAVFAAALRGSGVRVAYTRKIFHFGVFSGAALTHALWGLAGTNAYGSAVALLVLGAVARGDGDPFYEAMARDSDRPKRALFVVVPLLTTAVGGLASALLAGPYASVGYLVTGWGDAIGEPVGGRWGRHPYRVPSLGGVPAVRTLEGSLGVFIASCMAAAAALWGMGTGGPVLVGVVACALVGTAVEAVSHHGTDNLTIQVTVSLTAAWIFG